MPEETAASRARVERAVSLAPAESIRYDALVQDDRVHASLYTDPRIFADEMERIFHRGWVFVGHESEIPRAGDFVTRSLGTQPVIMVRSTDGAVSVLLNRCMHRGTMVCAVDRGTTRAFCSGSRTPADTTRRSTSAHTVSRARASLFIAASCSRA